MKILFNENIPADVVKSFVDNGDTVHLYGGAGLFSRQKPVFKLAKQAGLNEHLIHWGSIDYIIDRNQIDMFLSDDDKHSSTKVFAKYFPDDIKLSVQLNFKRVLMEQWKTQSDLTKGGESCPICLTLEEMGWIEARQPITYTWDSGSKTINGLPPYRMAHSSIGDGNWKVGDNVCKCYKNFRSEIVPDDFQFSKREVRIDLHKDCSHD